MCMLKKVVALGAVLLVGSWAVSRTDVGSYVKTFVKDSVACVKKNVPIEFEIRVAEEELANLDKVDDSLISTIAASMVAVESKQNALNDMQANLAKKKEDIRSRYAMLQVKDNKFYINDHKASREQFELEAEKACKSYKAAESIVENTKKMLADDQAQLDKAKEQRDALKSTKLALEDRIRKLKTDFEVLKAAEIRNKRSTGDGQIAELERLKNRIEGLESRIHQRIIENQLREDPKPAATVRSSVDIAQEMERILGDEADKK
jgi:chromosome segregation ATPase